MACRVGMTTDLSQRKQYWQRVHPDLHGWEILGCYNNKVEAQKAENSFAQRYGCVSGKGGDDPERSGLTWYVYRFFYD